MDVSGYWDANCMVAPAGGEGGSPKMGEGIRELYLAKIISL
jgi:hypothetical protein